MGNKHGGTSNAFTAMEDTNYYFQVTSEYLDGALDRFSKFFIEPLFAENMTEREIKAIDSEHTNNLLADHWRLFQLAKSMADPGHPFHKFGSGNGKTLTFFNFDQEDDKKIAGEQQ